MKEQKIKSKSVQNRGITLIALVVTIVVLLILAAVSISMLTGENGIINQAKDAKEDSEIAKERETVEISVTQAIERDKWGEITEKNLETELTRNIGERNVDYELNREGNNFVVRYIASNRSYLVDANGNVIEKGDENIVVTAEIVNRREDAITVKIISEDDLNNYQFSLDGQNWSEPQESNEYTFTNLTKVVVDETNYKTKKGTKYTVYAKAKTNKNKQINCQPVETSTIVEVIGNADYFEYEESENEIIITGLKGTAEVFEKIYSSEDEMLKDLNKIKIIPSYINGKPVTKICRNLFLQNTSRPVFFPKAYVYLIYKGDGSKNDIVMNAEEFDLETGQTNTTYYWMDGFYNFYTVFGNIYTFQTDVHPDFENWIYPELCFDYKIFSSEIVIPPTVKEFVDDGLEDPETPNMVDSVYSSESTHFTILGKDELREIGNGSILEAILQTVQNPQLDYIN